MTAVPDRAERFAPHAQELFNSITHIFARHLQADPSFRVTLMTQIALGQARDEIAALLEAYLSQGRIQTTRDAGEHHAECNACCSDRR
jgi:hypothetical protein